MQVGRMTIGDLRKIEAEAGTQPGPSSAGASKDAATLADPETHQVESSTSPLEPLPQTSVAQPLTEEPPSLPKDVLHPTATTAEAASTAKTLTSTMTPPEAETKKNPKETYNVKASASSIVDDVSGPRQAVRDASSRSTTEDPPSVVQVVHPCLAKSEVIYHPNANFQQICVLRSLLQRKSTTRALELSIRGLLYGLQSTECGG